MKKESVILVVTPPAVTWVLAEAMASVLRFFAAKEGGKGWAGWMGPTLLKIRLQGVPYIKVRGAVLDFVNRILQTNLALTFIERRENAAPFPSAKESTIPSGTVLNKRRLTKRLIYSLPCGAYVVSFDYSKGSRAFHESISDGNRDASWKRVLAAKVANRFCCVAWFEDQFRELTIPPV